MRRLRNRMDCHVNEPRYRHMHLWRARGFTLAEVMVALAVISVAVTIGITLYSAAATIGQNTRSAQAASTLAVEALAALRNHPHDYVWPALQTGEQVEIKARSGEQACSAPSVLPIEPRANRREAAFYTRCAWQAYARLPEEHAPYMELAIVIRWNAAGQARAFTLTTLAPRALAEGGA